MTPEEKAAAYDALAAERDQLRGQLDAASGERDAARGDLRDIRHRAAFREVALASEVREDAVDALYQLTGYAPGADEIDADAITAAITDGKARFSFTVKPPAPEVPAPTTPAAKPPAPRAPGASRGTAPTAPGRLKVSADQLADPGWMMANQAAFREAGKAGTLDLV